MLPRTLIFFIAGKNAANVWEYIKSPSVEGFYKLIPLALIIISIFGIGKIIKQSLEKARAIPAEEKK